MSVVLQVEQLVVDRLREWLLLKLPGRVTSVNASRAAVLKTPGIEPFTVPVGATLKLSVSRVDDPSPVSVALTSGSRTAAQLAADFALVAGVAAAADSTGRFTVTSSTAPTEGTDSLVVLGEDATGANVALGFDAGGEWVISSAIICPGVKGIRDGAPMMPDFGPGFWVILGDNASVPMQPDIRKDENWVAVAVTVAVPVPSNSSQQGREHLRAALRAVREVLFAEDGGRTLGNAAGIQKVTERQALVKSRPIGYAELPNVLFHRAQLELNVLVYERQA